MKEVVEKVLKEEELARSRLDKARAEAESLVAKANSETAADHDENIAKLKDASRQRIGEAKKAFLAEKENALLSVKNESSASCKSREKDIPAIARGIFERIINIEDTQ